MHFKCYKMIKNVALIYLINQVARAIGFGPTCGDNGHFRKASFSGRDHNGQSTSHKRCCAAQISRIYAGIQSTRGLSFGRFRRKDWCSFCECHVKASKLIPLGTIDVPLDPDEQSEYRANREIVSDAAAFARMK